MIKFRLHMIGNTGCMVGKKRKWKGGGGGEYFGYTR